MGAFRQGDSGDEPVTTSNRNFVSGALIKRLRRALRISHSQATDLHIQELFHVQ